MSAVTIWREFGASLFSPSARAREVLIRWRVKKPRPMRARAMNDLQVGEHDVLSFLKPDTLFGALVYLVVFLLAALLLSRALRTLVHAAMTRKGHGYWSTRRTPRPRRR